MSNTFIFSIDDAVDGSYALSTLNAYNLTGQNTGNLAFHYAMVKILGGPQEAMPWDTPLSRVNGMRRIGVLPLANQLGPHADYKGLGERFAELDIPLIAVGLGAQGSHKYTELPVVPEGTLNWVRQIVKRSPKGAANIGVRGPFTQQVLEHYGFGENVIVTGCPTLFLNPDPELGAKIEQRAARPLTRIAMASGHQGWTHLGRLEASLCELVEFTGGACLQQSPIQMVQLARGEADDLSAADLEACRAFCCPHLETEEFKTWSRRHFRVFFNVSEWMECLRGFDFIVGARIHGVMLGLQAGIPGLCITHDSRTREMCETMRVPFVMAGDVIKGMSIDDLRRHFAQFDGAAFDRNRRVLADRLNRFLVANEVADSAWLRGIQGK